jgi:hypothetical protein
VIIAKDNKVTSNHAFAKGKLTDAGIKSVLSDVQKLVE